MLDIFFGSREGYFLFPVLDEFYPDKQPPSPDIAQMRMGAQAGEPLEQGRSNPGALVDEAVLAEIIESRCSGGASDRMVSESLGMEEILASLEEGVDETFFSGHRA